MKEVFLIFPHQLFEEIVALKNATHVFLIEEHLFFRELRFHKQKLAFHRASMKSYADFLSGKSDATVEYVDAKEKRADIRKFFSELSKNKPDKVHFIDPVDDWLEKRLLKAAQVAGIELVKHPTPMFLNSADELQQFFKKKAKKYFQAKFYIAERKKRDLLLEKGSEPLGGKWSFDTENRKKYPADKQPRPVRFPKPDKHFEEAQGYVEKNFAKNPGRINAEFFYPRNHDAARKWFRDFLKERFADFGPYEDAIVAEESILNHSVLSPLLNSGLLTPDWIIDETIAYAEANDIPLNSLEGFVRQIIGWREFIRAVYMFRGGEQRTTNFWDFERRIPASFYDATVGIEPVDQTIRKVLDTGYCHHIERLMVLGNFMLLCEFDPDEVYRWFMELFIDAYDWVMVPNVYGMSQFADGGLMATKPYISGSNYLLKMSDYEKGDWHEIWDALFWRFMQVHRDYLSTNPRLKMLLANFDRRDKSDRKKLLDTADKFLDSLAG